MPAEQAQAARQAQDVAEAKKTEAESAKTLADANEEIASQNERVQEAQATNTYAWCAYLVSLGQDCALVKAAESGDFPVVYGTDAQVVVPLPTETAPTTTAPAG